MAYSNKPVIKAGNYSTTISQLGKVTEATNEQGETITSTELLLKSDYGFSIPIKYGNDKVSGYINLPYFKVNTNPKDYSNYLNIRDFKIDGIIQPSPDNESIAAKTYTDTIFTYMVDLLSVYVPKVEGKTKIQATRDVCYDLFRKSKFKSPFFVFYGCFEDGVWQGENEEPTHKVSAKGNDTYYGKVDDKSTYLHVANFNGTDYYFSDAVFYAESELLNETELANSSMIYTSWMGSFIEMCLEYVIEHNKGQRGYGIRSWTEDKKGNWYLNPVNNLKSLVISRGGIKTDDGYVTITPENQADYPSFQRYFYGSTTGLTSKEMNYKVGDVWVSRLQFPFGSEPRNEGIEGTDSTQTYRSKYNPKLIMTKPEIVVNQEDEEDAVVDPNILYDENGVEIF